MFDLTKVWKNIFSVALLKYKYKFSDQLEIRISILMLFISTIQDYILFNFKQTICLWLERLIWLFTVLTVNKQHFPGTLHKSTFKLPIICFYFTVKSVTPSVSRCLITFKHINLDAQQQMSWCVIWLEHQGSPPYENISFVIQ
jgi:hypothetical protein